MERGIRGPRKILEESWFQALSATQKGIILQALLEAAWDLELAEDAGVVLEPGELLISGRRFAERMGLSRQEWRTADEKLKGVGFWTSRRAGERVESASLYKITQWERYIYPGEKYRQRQSAIIAAQSTSNPGSNPGPGKQTNPGTDQASNPGSNPGPNPGSNPGPDAERNPMDCDIEPTEKSSHNPGSNPGPNPGSNPGPGSQSNPGEKHLTNPGSNPRIPTKNGPPGPMDTGLTSHSLARGDLQRSIAAHRTGQVRSGQVRVCEHMHAGTHPSDPPGEQDSQQPSGSMQDPVVIPPDEDAGCGDGEQRPRSRSGLNRQELEELSLAIAEQWGPGFRKNALPYTDAPLPSGREVSLQRMATEILPMVDAATPPEVVPSEPRTLEQLADTVLEWWSALIDRIHRTPFLIGQGPAREGKAPFRLSLQRMAHGRKGDPASWVRRILAGDFDPRAWRVADVAPILPARRPQLPPVAKEASA